jgi:uncharacterized protein YjbJ (UPF0337 family)
MQAFNITSHMGRLTSITRRCAATRCGFPVVIGKRSNDEMDKDRIAGSAKEAKGVIKETGGKAIGDAKLTAEGKSDKAKGKVQNTIGGLKDALKE